MKKQWTHSSPLNQSGQITGSGTEPNLVQVCLIRYIQSHNASKLYKFLTDNLREISNFGESFHQNIILRSEDNSIEYKTKRYSTYKVHFRKLIMLISI